MFPPRQSPPSPSAASLANYLFFHGTGFRLRIPIERRTSLRRFDDRTQAESTFLVHARNIEIIMEPRNLGLRYVCHSCLARLVKALFPFLCLCSSLVSFLFFYSPLFLSRFSGPRWSCIFGENVPAKYLTRYVTRVCPKICELQPES